MDISLHAGVRFVAKGKGKRVYQVIQVRPKSIVVVREDSNTTHTLSTEDKSTLSNMIAEVL